MNKPIVIAGAGPVGLVLALLLEKQGKEVLVFESAAQLQPLGVGINLLPHSVRVLFDLGLQSHLDRLGVRTKALHYYNKFGQAIWSEPRGLAAGYPFPQYSIHRGEFQMMLLEVALSRLGSESVRLGHRLVSWEDTDDGVNVQFSVAERGEEVSVSGACLIAADGIHSTARAALYPEEGPPIFGGRVLWRGVSRSQGFLDSHTMFMAGYQDCKFVAYPISHTNSANDGTCLVNWIAELAIPDYDSRQDWTCEVSAEDIIAPFESWHFGWVDIPGLINSAEVIYEYPLSDRDPLPSWTRGKMTLIGDAAHPMYPIGSNGASQGILDAEKLANEFSKAQSIEASFEAYESERRPATSQIVLSNRKNGPEQVMQLAEERAPNGFDRVEDVISRAELEDIAARYKQTAGFSVSDVQKKVQKKTALPR